MGGAHFVQNTAFASEAIDPSGHGRHCVAFADDTNVPGLHGVQSVAPYLLLYVPGAHGEQNGDDGIFEYVPCAHAIQFTDLEFDHDPTGHSSHEVFIERLPGAHAVHSIDPVDVDAVPIGHDAHRDIPIDPPYVPCGHARQVVALIPNVPIGQAWHCVCSRFNMDPIGQMVHDDDDSEEEYRPLGH